MSERKYSGRQVASLVIVLGGLVVLLTSAVQNPWVSQYIKGAVHIEYRTVLASYFYWSVLIGGSTVVLGSLIGTKSSGVLDGLCFFVLVLGGLILADRYVLTKLNLTLWEFDPDLHYRHRAGAIRTLDSVGRPYDLVKINSYGYHDTEFAELKAAGELRGLMLGDSVTMGFGVTYDETYAKHTELKLASQLSSKYDSIQMINTGVHGYSTHQELLILKEALRFDPDIIFVGFCMNDVTEPFIVDERFGGVGLDYHGVMQTSGRVAGYLVNETGFGRLLQTLSVTNKSYQEEKLREVYSTRQMAGSSVTDDRFAAGWRSVLSSLEEIYSLAAAEGKPVVLLVFPFTYQLLGEDLREPQKILTEHAVAHDIAVIDFTDVLAKHVYEDTALVRYLRGKGYDQTAIEAVFQSKIDEYFFDEDHLTSRGHQLVSDGIVEFLKKEYFEVFL